MMRRRPETNQTPGAYPQADRRRHSIVRSSLSVLAAAPVITKTAQALGFIDDVAKPFSL
jgi:hypothetical protein